MPHGLNVFIILFGVLKAPLKCFKQDDVNP